MVTLADSGKRARASKQSQEIRKNQLPIICSQNIINFMPNTVKPALAVTRLSRGTALAVEIPGSQLFSTFYEATLPA